MTDMMICATCGKGHPKSESELVYRLPDEVFLLPEDERESRCQSNSDLVVLDDERFFLRGVLPLEVTGREKAYHLGVWAEISRGAFEKIIEVWDEDAQDEEPALSGMLANQVPFHANTLGLELVIRLTGPKTRPKFFLAPVEHSLFAEQSQGIDEHRAFEYSDPDARSRN